VVPQKKHTAAKARYGLNRGWRGNFQRSIWALRAGRRARGV
jgi:hypothetical protein